MEHRRYPLVSIGVPVFNGEVGIERALDSLLRQDYPNLEVIISDNASVDRTQSICEEYACRDPRVRYFRSQENRGVVANFNRVFQLSSGEYFMFAAHDDHRALSFVTACVEQMEQRKDAVLCQAHTAVSVTGHEGMLYIAHLDSFAGAKGVVGRYRETLKHFPATAVYGLYRASAMGKTQLWHNIIATDVAFILELSIHGAFVQVPEVLFSYCARETWNSIHKDAEIFLGMSRKPWWYSPFIALLKSHCRRLATAPIPFGIKTRLAGILLAHETTRLVRQTLIKVAGMCCPASRKEQLGRAIYRRWMQNPNVTIVSEELFMARVCKPQLGWWSG